MLITGNSIGPEVPDPNENPLPELVLAVRLAGLVMPTDFSDGPWSDDPCPLRWLFKAGAPRSVKCTR